MIGALLAGGRGRRMGGGKPARELAGRPLIAWPAEALAQACSRVVVVAKAATELPRLEGVERWDEPDATHHPARGIAFAVERAGEPVLVCAADMPFVTAAACRAVAAGLGEGAARRGGGSAQAGGVAEPIASVAVAGGVLQPVFAAYEPEALGALRGAAPDASLTSIVRGLDPLLVEVEPDLVRSVDTAEDLARAEAELGLRGA